MKQEIPWNRFAVEAIVIVGSILLAFAIDAWWDSRQDDSRRDELLLQLQSSFTNHINQAEIAIRGATRSSENVRSFILSSPDEIELVAVQLPGGPALRVLRSGGRRSEDEEGEGEDDEGGGDAADGEGGHGSSS